MQGKLIEILIILMNEINRRGIEFERMEILSGKLLDQGYSESEISTAFSWMIERFGSLNNNIQPNPKSYRVLHDIEKVFISPEAFGYLLQLNVLGLLNMEEMERIIERSVISSSPKMSVDEIKSLVIDVLFDDNEVFGGEYESLMPDDIVQ